MFGRGGATRFEYLFSGNDDLQECPAVIGMRLEAN